MKRHRQDLATEDGPVTISISELRYYCLDPPAKPTAVVAFIWTDAKDLDGANENTISLLSELTRLRSVNEELLAACKVALQLAEIADDWNLDEVEIDGAMRPTIEVADLLRTAIAHADEQK